MVAAVPLVVDEVVAWFDSAVDELSSTRLLLLVGGIIKRLYMPRRVAVIFWLRYRNLPTGSSIGCSGTEYITASFLRVFGSRFYFSRDGVSIAV